ncbi:5669_t:CDS:2, partial [Ambispora leptoticha]
MTQIVSDGGFLGKGTTLAWFSAINAGLVSALSWILVMNAIVGFQLVDDGSIISMGGILLGGILIFFGVGYIALDTAFNISGHFTSQPSAQMKNVALYITYIIFPLFAVVAYVILETILVIVALGDKQSLGIPHLCEASSQIIDGSLFCTLFVFLAVFLLYKYWSSITEDVWEEYDYFNPETLLADILSPPPLYTRPEQPPEMGIAPIGGATTTILEQHESKSVSSNENEEGSISSISTVTDDINNEPPSSPP